MQQICEQLERQIATMLARLDQVIADSGMLTAEHRALLDEAQGLVKAIDNAVIQLERARAH